MAAKDEKLGNPVEVKVGKYLKEDETPLYQWQIEQDPE